MHTLRRFELEEMRNMELEYMQQLASEVTEDLDEKTLHQLVESIAKLNEYRDQLARGLARYTCTDEIWELAKYQGVVTE